MNILIHSTIKNLTNYDELSQVLDNLLCTNVSQRLPSNCITIYSNEPLVRIYAEAAGYNFIFENVNTNDISLQIVLELSNKYDSSSIVPKLLKNTI